MDKGLTTLKRLRNEIATMTKKEFDELVIRAQKRDRNYETCLIRLNKQY